MNMLIQNPDDGQRIYNCSCHHVSRQIMHTSMYMQIVQRIMQFIIQTISYQKLSGNRYGILRTVFNVFYVVELHKFITHALLP